MRKFIGVVLAGILILGGLVGCASAELEVSPATITPSEVVVGEPFTVSVEIANIGGAEGTHTSTLTLDGSITDTKEVTVSAGATETVSFICTVETAGNHILDLNGLVTTITALKSAEFNMVSIFIPEDVITGDTVAITADVANVGEAEGDYTVTLKLNEEEVDSQDVTIAGGETETVRFTVVKDIVGIYNIEVNTLTGTMRVSPAPPTGYKGHADWENGFFIAYPERWELGEKLIGAVVNFRDYFGNQIGVSMENLDYRMSAKAYFVEGEKTIKLFTPGYTTISSEEVRINEIPAVKSIYTISFTREEITVEMKGLQVWMVRDKTAFSITCNSLELETYALLTDTFDAVIGSFRFLP